MRFPGGWYVPAALGGTRTNRRRNSRIRAIGAGLASLALAASLAACGSETSSDANEAEGSYEMKVVKATFPTDQHLGQTSLMKVAVRNTGDKAVPAVAITVSVAGKEGQTSALPFGIRDPQPDLAQPDRPVWVLAEGYPKTSTTTTKRGGGTSSSRKTFVFGSLKPGATVEGIWKLSAVKPGRFTVLYGVDAGLSGAAKAKTAAGVAPGGSFKVDVSNAPVNTEVTDSGEVVEINPHQGKKNTGG
jgi:hypothetical protein